jgi:hypothetical protein
LTDSLKPQGELRPLCLKAAEAIAELRSRAAPQTLWQPIETAPSDGPRVLVTGGAWAHPEVVMPDGNWWRQRKREGGKGQPSHWMQIPDVSSLSRPHQRTQEG